MDVDIDVDIDKDTDIYIYISDVFYTTCQYCLNHANTC